MTSSAGRPCHIACKSSSALHSFLPSFRPSLLPSFPSFLPSFLDLLIFACAHSSCVHALMRSCTYALIHLRIHAFMHSGIQAYMHSCIHAFMHSCIQSVSQSVRPSAVRLVSRSVGRSDDQLVRRSRARAIVGTCGSEASSRYIGGSSPRLDRRWPGQRKETPRFVGFARHSFVGAHVYILQRGVQWKQGVVICMALHTFLLYDTTPIHCNPLRLHPPLMNTQHGFTAAPCSVACLSWSLTSLSTSAVLSESGNSEPYYLSGAVCALR